MLRFVGVGPGDPELLTLKALRCLREADAIALPDKGRALAIVERWIEGKPLLKLRLPMSGKREEWRHHHAQAVQQLLAWLSEYKCIAFLVLGDPGIYATSSYLYRLIKDVHPCELVPGVPAMCAAAASLGVPLCEQGEPLTVVDHFGDGQALPGGNVVLMKSCKHLDDLRGAVEGRRAYVARNLGMEDEWLGALDSAPSMDGFYFTTTIVRP